MKGDAADELRELQREVIAMRAAVDEQERLWTRAADAADRAALEANTAKRWVVVMLIVWVMQFLSSVFG